MSKRQTRGFSLIEMMAVLSIVIIVSAIAAISLQGVAKSSRVTNAYNLTLMAMRQARDTAISERQTYYVTFTHNTTPPDVITITDGATGTVVNTYQLPIDVSFQVISGIPTAAGTTPDGFGLGALALDFDQGISGGTKNIIYFYPDGSGQDSVGNINNGVLYVARIGDLYSSHAITLWGATGRLRGWRLLKNSSSNPYWRQM